MATGGGRPSPAPREELSLTLLPHLPRDGWMTVQATLAARLLPAAGSTDPVLLDSTASRTLPIGVPFEVSVTAPGAEGREQEGAATAGETYVVQITPYVPSPSIPGH
jgi:hypothetical protein